MALVEARNVEWRLVAGLLVCSIESVSSRGFMKKLPSRREGLWLQDAKDESDVREGISHTVRCQTEHDDGEDGLRNAQGQGEVESHDVLTLDGRWSRKCQEVYRYSTGRRVANYFSSWGKKVDLFSVGGTRVSVRMRRREEGASWVDEGRQRKHRRSQARWALACVRVRSMRSVCHHRNRICAVTGLVHVDLSAMLMPPKSKLLRSPRSFFFSRCRFAVLSGLEAGFWASPKDERMVGGERDDDGAC